MPCSFAFACDAVGVLVGDGHGQLLQRARRAVAKTGRRVRELGEDDEPHGQERRGSRHRGVDHREHAVGVGPHLRDGRSGSAGRSGRRRRSSGWASSARSDASSASIGGRRARARRACRSAPGRSALPRGHRGRRVGRRVRIPGHAVEGQRQHDVGAGGVDVHLLAEAVAVEQERARPARGSGGSAARVEGQRDLVARARDHEHVVGRRQQLAHVARARVAARDRLPGREPRRRARSRSRTARGRRARPRPRSRARAGPRAPGRGGAARARRAAPERPTARLVPVDAHVRHDAARGAIGPRQLAGQIHDERLRPAHGDADVCRPRSRQRRRRPATSQARGAICRAGLVRGHVVAGERVVGPAGEEQQACGPPGRPARSSVERVLLRVAADAVAGGSSSTNVRSTSPSAGRDVAAGVVGRPRRRARVAHREEPERLGRRRVMPSSG